MNNSDAKVRIPSYVSLGGFIVDDIRFEDGSETKGVVGGGGTHALFGMRLWCPTSEAWRIGFTLAKGNDFPPDLEKLLRELGFTLVVQDHPLCKTPRAWNIFKPGGVRDFHFTTSEHEWNTIFKTHTIAYPLQFAKYFHALMSPQRCCEIYERILSGRETCDQEKGVRDYSLPLIVWEPSPRSCNSDNFPDAFVKAARLATIVTPNHYELAELVSHSSRNHEENGERDLTYSSDISDLHEMADLVLKACDGKLGPDGQGALIIRAGERGCFVVACRKNQVPIKCHVPPYWTEEDFALRVIDTTGAGNAFSGGLCVGLEMSGCDPVEAALYATVSASYAVEQTGVPQIMKTGSSELYNSGPHPAERLRILKERLKISL